MAWFLLGIAIGAAVMLPVLRVLLRRGEKRARDAERRAAESERLAELGSMTSGLAHEIKNPLSTIGLNAQLLSEAVADASMHDDEKMRLARRLDALRREVDRLSGILADFLQFAGRVKLDPQPLDLRRLVEELGDFFHPQCDRAGVLLRTDLPGAAVIADVDEALMKQAVLNLMINATQAMDSRKGDAGDANSTSPGELILRVEGDDDEARIHVTDTGPGIESERLEEIFRPFVSRRSTGTGLGLPTARRIVQEHGGRLVVHSEVGQGSDFVIKLPRR